MSSTENLLYYEGYYVHLDYDEENQTVFNDTRIFDQSNEDYSLYFDSNFTLEHAIAEYVNKQLDSGFIPYAVIFVISTLGVLFNLINVVIYARPSMVSSINMLLLAFEAANIVFFLTFLIQGVEYFSSNKVVYTFPWAIYKIGNPYVRLTTSCLSNWLAVTIGLWRCVAVGMTMKANKLLSRTRAKLVITFLVVVSPLLTTPSLLLSTYKEETVGYYEDVTSTDPVKNFTLYTLHKTQIYTQVFYYFNWITLIVTFVPCLILLVATSFLIFNLKRASEMRKILTEVKETTGQVRDRKITYMLLVVLVTFVLSYLPDGICVCILLHNYETFLSGTMTWSQGGYCKTMIMDGIYPLLSNCITFFIYYFMSENFRYTFDHLFFNKFIFRRKSTSSTTTTSSIFHVTIAKSTTVL